MTRITDVLFHPVFQGLAYAVLAALIAFGRALPMLHHQVYSALFLIVILNVATNPRRLFTLENAFLRFMGRISYGLYMYHFAVIAAVLLVVTPYLAGMSVVAQDLVVYTCVLAGTTVVAAASYYGFERPFLRWKARFTSITSGPPSP